MAAAFIASSGRADADTDVSTLTMDSSGADFIVALCMGPVSNHPSVDLQVSDSKSNTWTKINLEDGGYVYGSWFYTIPTSVGGSHIFNAGGFVFNLANVWVFAFSGMSTIPEDDNNFTSPGAFVEAFQVGSLDPVEVGEVLIAGMRVNVSSGPDTNPAIDSDYTGAIYDVESGVHYGAAYKIKSGSDEDPENPEWSWTGEGVSADVYGYHSSWKPAGGGGGGGNPWYYRAQQRMSLKDKWKRAGLIWTPSYA